MTEELNKRVKTPRRFGMKVFEALKTSLLPVSIHKMAHKIVETDNTAALRKAQIIPTRHH
jgi:hypothetical protein